MSKNTKSKRHIFYCAVHLFLIKDNQILLLKRQNTGYRDGFYSVPAGHIDEDESSTSAMLREAYEEIGILIEPKDLKFIHVMHRNKTDAGRINFFFTTGKWTKEIINMEPQKCNDLSWFPLNRLPENMVPYVKSALDQYINKNQFSEFGWK